VGFVRQLPGWKEYIQGKVDTAVCRNNAYWLPLPPLSDLRVPFGASGLLRG